ALGARRCRSQAARHARQGAAPDRTPGRPPAGRGAEGAVIVGSSLERSQMGLQRALARLGAIDGVVGTLIATRDGVTVAGAGAGRRLNGQGEQLPMERTLIIVKPDGVQRGLIGEILGRFERKGFRLVALKLMPIDRPTAERHYAVHHGKFFYESLVSYISSGP